LTFVNARRQRFQMIGTWGFTHIDVASLPTLVLRVCDENGPSIINSCDPNPVLVAVTVGIDSDYVLQ
jgi:hypothetical protein